MRPTSPRLRVETLEDRTTPATITVTTLVNSFAQDWQVSLREAIQAAETAPAVNEATAGAGPDTIVFATGLNLEKGTILFGGNTGFDTRLNADEAGPSQFVV